MLIAQIIGNLGHDAEVRHIGDKNYISFSVASTEKQGEQEAIIWVSVLASHNPDLLPFLKKGQQVFVSGRMSAKIYHSQQNFGINISVFAQTLQLCGSKREKSSVSSGTKAAPNNPTPPTAPTSATPSSFAGNGIPPFPPQVEENGNPKDSDDLPF